MKIMANGGFNFDTTIYSGYEIRGKEKDHIQNKSGIDLIKDILS
jgi:hypothetical protein